MNEKGVELRSEAHMTIACAAQEIPVPKHKLIFDKPFLIVMERADAKMPYFALWVDNPEILVSWNSPSQSGSLPRFFCLKIFLSKCRFPSGL